MPDDRFGRCPTHDVPMEVESGWHGGCQPHCPVCRAYAVVQRYEASKR